MDAISFNPVHAIRAFLWMEEISHYPVQIRSVTEVFGDSTGQVICNLYMK